MRYGRRSRFPGVPTGEGANTSPSGIPGSGKSADYLKTNLLIRQEHPDTPNWPDVERRAHPSAADAEKHVGIFGRLSEHVFDYTLLVESVQVFINVAEMIVNKIYSFQNGYMQQNSLSSYHEGRRLT